MLSTLAGAILLTIVHGDVRARLIPNELIVVLAVTGLANVGFGEMGITAALGTATALFGISLPLFALGLVGGGDVKLLAAVGLWIPPAALYDFFTVMALTGAVLALAVVARRRVVAAVTGAAAAEPASVPYGAAIAAGAGYVLFAPI